MAKWNKTCKEFKDVREQIYAEDSVGIMKSLLNICRKYAKDDDEWAYDFEILADEIEEMGIEECEECDEETADWYLSEFYDLCDAARVWLDF